MSSLLLLAGLTSYALAADVPEVLVVGVHLPGLSSSAAAEAARTLTEALDATGKVDAVPPAEVSARIAGRESLILTTYALGPGRDRLQKGRLLYEGAQPDQAIPELEEAVRLLAGGFEVATDPREVHEALMLLGMSHVGLGNDAAAREAFARSASWDPGRRIDAVNYPPDVVALFDEVKAEIAARPPASLGVSASEEARVWVDGREVGTTPVSTLSLPPGQHALLVRAADGTSVFQTIELREGVSRTVTANLSTRSLGTAAADSAGRSRQTRDLYRGVGAYAGTTVVALAGAVGPDQVAVQLYSPASGNFSRALTGDAGNDPAAAIADLAPALAGYVAENGDIRTDRVSPQVIALDVSDNDVLAGLLFEPPEPGREVVEVTRGPKWYVWAGAGALVAGGATAATVLLLQPGDEPEDPNQGTIEFGPIP